MYVVDQQLIYHIKCRAAHLGVNVWIYDYFRAVFAHFLVLGVTIFNYADNGVLIWSKRSHLTISINKFLSFETKIIAIGRLEKSKMIFLQKLYFSKLPPLILCNQLVSSNFLKYWFYFNHILTLIRWGLLINNISILFY